MSATSPLDPHLTRGNWSYWAVTHRPLILFAIIALMVAGLFAYTRLGRAEDPSFTIKIATITVIWPGATAREVQDQVAERIEKKMQELAWFDRVQTYAKSGFAAIQVQFRDNTPAREVPQLFYQLRKKLDDIRGELPAGIIGPNVNDEFGDVDSVLYTLTGEGVDFAEMKRIAERLRMRMLRVPNVVKVNVYGVQDERIFVEFSHAKLATRGIPPAALFESLQRQNLVAPAGSIDTGAARVPLRLTGALDGAEAVAATPIDVGGRSFRLGDVATVSRGFVDPPSYVIRHEGRPALAIGVVMARGANITTLGADLRAAKAEFLREVPVGIEFEQIADQRRWSRRRSRSSARPSWKRSPSCSPSPSSRSAGARASSSPCRCRWCSRSCSSPCSPWGSICTASRSARSSSRSGCWSTTRSSRSR